MRKRERAATSYCGCCASPSIHELHSYTDLGQKLRSVEPSELPLGHHQDVGGEGKCGENAPRAALRCRPACGRVVGVQVRGTQERVRHRGRADSALRREQRLATLCLLAHTLVSSFQLLTLAAPKRPSRKRTYAYVLHRVRTLRSASCSSPVLAGCVGPMGARCCGCLQTGPRRPPMKTSRMRPAEHFALACE